MRLTEQEVAAIKAAARDAFGPDAVVRLFGSRLDDARRGGDIDLLIEVDEGAGGITNEARFLRNLFCRIDEQRVDLLLRVRGKPDTAFIRHVLPRSVAL